MPAQQASAKQNRNRRAAPRAHWGGGGGEGAASEAKMSFPRGWESLRLKIKQVPAGAGMAIAGKRHPEAAP